MSQQSEGSVGRFEKGESGGTEVRLKRSQLVVLFMGSVVFHDLPGCAYSPKVNLTWVAGIRMLIFFQCDRSGQPGIWDIMHCSTTGQKGSLALKAARGLAQLSVS